MTVVEEILRNRESGAKRLVKEYKAGLLPIARRLCDDESDAEHLVNSALAEAVARIDEYAGKGLFFSWICGIMQKDWSKSVRRKSNEKLVYSRDVPESEGNGEDDVYNAVDYAIVRDVIHSMPKDMKDVIVLHYFMDATVGQIARTLSIPIGTVKSRLHFARLALAKRLGVKIKRHLAMLTVFAGLALFSVAATMAVVWHGAKPSAEETSAKEPAAQELATGEAAVDMAAAGETGEMACGADSGGTTIVGSAGQDAECVESKEGEPDMDITKAASAALAAGIVAAAPAPAVGTVYTAGATSLENGKIAITYDAAEPSKIKTLVAKPEGGETLTLTGAAMTFADGATLSFAAPSSGAVANGSLVFANDVAADGALAVNRTDGAYVVFDKILHEVFQEVVPSGVTSLADWEVASIYGCATNLTSTNTQRGRFNLLSKGVVYSSSNPAAENRAFVLNRWCVDKCHTWSVRIQLRCQTASDTLEARINTIVHSPQNVYLPTTDLWTEWWRDMPAGSGLYASQSVRDSAGGAFTGAWPAQAQMDRLILRRANSSAAVGFSGGASFAGAVDVALGVKFAVLSGTGGTFAAPVFTGEGDIEYRRDATLAAPNRMKYSPDFDVMDGATVTVTANSALPTNGVVNVNGGGVLLLRTSANSLSGGYPELFVRRGGELRVAKDSAQHTFENGKQRIVVDGGTLWIAYDTEYSAGGGWATSRAYLPFLTLTGGARIRGLYANWGNNQQQRWSVFGEGAEPATIDAVGSLSYKKQEFTLVVDDVTGDDGADCIVNGEIPAFEANSANFRYYETQKYGDGTLRLNGKWAMRGTVTVNAGGIVFGDEGSAFPTGIVSELRTSAAGYRNFVLKDGATLGKTSGTLELDTLTVTNGATLDLGDSAIMTFADSHACAWSGDVVLKNFANHRVRFGTSGSSLTAEQVSSIRTDEGRKVSLFSNGWLGFPGLSIVLQ